METLLEVAVLHARDVQGAVEGGADRLSFAVDGRSPDVSSAAAVVRAAGEVPVRVMLRLDETLTATGSDLVRMTELGEEYVALGAEGVELGFLDRHLDVDVATTRALAHSLPGVPWTFHGAFDSTLDHLRSWGRVVDMRGLTAVVSAGSPRGLAQGCETLLGLARLSPDVARLLMPAGGARPDLVPWLVQAGVRQLRLGPEVRPDASTRAYVDADRVRSWRTLLDDQVRRAASAR